MPRIISPAPSIPEVLETPENACGGVLVALLPGLGPQTPPVRRGHFFDNSIDRGAVLEAFIGWFSLWGIPVCRMRGGEGPFERQFSTLQWPSEACVLAHAHGVQMVPRIASRIDELAVVLEQRRPRLVIFLSRYLWLAANLPESRERLAAAAGAPLDEGRRISAHRLNATHQRWQRLEMLALAQPSKNTTREYVAGLAPAVQQILAHSGVIAPPRAADPLLPRARDCLVVDRAASIQSVAARLHVDAARAEAIFDALEGDAWRSDGGRLLALRKG